MRERERERGSSLTEVDFTERTASDLAAELVLAANDALHKSKVPETSEVEFGNLPQHKIKTKESRICCCRCFCCFSALKHEGNQSHTLQRVKESPYRQKKNASNAWGIFTSVKIILCSRGLCNNVIILIDNVTSGEECKNKAGGCK